MTDSLQKGWAAYNRLVERHPEAIPFYNLRPVPSGGSTP